jgi:hypothetical protein
MTQQFEDTKGVIRSVNRRRTDIAITNIIWTKRHKTVYTKLHRKITIGHHESHQKPGVNSGATEE